MQEARVSRFVGSLSWKLPPPTRIPYEREDTLHIIVTRGPLHCITLINMYLVLGIIYYEYNIIILYHTTDIYFVCIAVRTYCSVVALSQPARIIPPECLRPPLPRHLTSQTPHTTQQTPSSRPSRTFLVHSFKLFVWCCFSFDIYNSYISYILFNSRFTIFFEQLSPFFLPHFEYQNVSYVKV